MAEYEAVIGLETHVQLKTRSKMWCGCANRYGDRPNTNICPVCLGYPGALPVPNREALRLTALAGMLLGGEIPPLARFDRKNYFYPDMPKNYQITQMARPSALGGRVEFESGGDLRSVRIARAHLEEDVGKSFHFDQCSGVDYNRAGVPLMEIVSEPDIRGAGMAYDYLQALVAILEAGGVSGCDLEKGMVRCDVNVSVRPRGVRELGAKIEIKNMNTFNGVRRAIEHEAERQIGVLEEGGTLRQETRRWNDDLGRTDPMRLKEDAHDYRYLPDPDLPPFVPDPAFREEAARGVVELPLARKRRLASSHGLPPEDAASLVRHGLAGYFEDLMRDCRHPRTAANWLLNNLQARLAAQGPALADLPFPPRLLGQLLDLLGDGTISSRIAQEVFTGMLETGDSPGDIIERRGLSQVSDEGALQALCEQVIEAHPGPAADYRAGRRAALNFLKGQAMRLSRGKANPRMIGEALERLLGP